MDHQTLDSWGVPNPTRLAFDSDGALYVLDSSRRKLVKVDERGTLLHEVVISGSNAISTTEPVDLAVDARGSILVFDRAGTSILAYDKKGNLLAERPIGSSLLDDARDPRASIMLDAFGRIWLLAPRERDLVRLTPSLERDRQGRFLTPDDFLTTPSIAVATPNGTTWIADATSASVSLFRASGSLIGTISVADSTEPAAVGALAADHYNYVYAADRVGQRIVVFSPDGTRLLEQFTGGSTRPFSPTAIAWGARGDRLAIADSKHGEVRIGSIARSIGPSSGDAAKSERAE